MVFSSEADTTISGDGQSFANADILNGDGWWTRAELKTGLWRQDEWQLDFSVAGSYREESYDLSYSVLQQTGTVMVDGTNGAPATTVQILDWVPTGTDTVFTEKLVTAGLMLSRANKVWSGSLGFEIILYGDAALDSPISTSTQTYKVSFDRKDPFSITAGVSVEQWGLHWFTDLSLIGEDSLRLGAAVVF